jgi:hypothetical protein
MWEHQISRFEYSAVSWTWPLLNECAVYLLDFTTYQTKLRSRVEAELIKELWVNSYPLLTFHLITALFRHSPQLSWRTVPHTTVILPPPRSSTAYTRLCTRWCVRVIYWMIAVVLRKSRYRCGRLLGKGRIRNFRFDRSYSGTCDDNTIFIVVAGQRGLDANVANDSKWVLDIHLIGSVQSR